MQTLTIVVDKRADTNDILLYAKRTLRRRLKKTAIGALGFTEINWYNLTGKEEQPCFIGKKWAEIIVDDRKQVAVFGFTARNRDSKSTRFPELFTKSWIDLQVCGERTSKTF